MLIMYYTQLQETMVNKNGHGIYSREDCSSGEERKLVKELFS